MTLVPSLIVTIGVELPIVLVPRLLFRMNPAVMGSFVNKKATTWGLGAIVAVISLLNGWLIAEALGGLG